MTSHEIRNNFIQYFKKRGHAHVASAPVVPHDDPTLLFNNSGMSQFKDVFLGKSIRDYTSATTAQKCIRVGGKHNDLDNVGHTTRHLTFFEMLGNFSFGDYFKEKAIQFAWEVTCEVFKFAPEKIWVTVFENDDEAFSLWEKHVPSNRIVRMGEKDNFWAMGETGPCGPCSELLYDRGSHFSHATSPKDDPSGERYLEFWNLVFMQYNRDASGTLTSLPKKCIDTGAGLERIISLRENVSTVFATDILRSLIAGVEEVSGKKYDPKNEHLAPAFHVIADHIRSLAFSIADGVQPSNLDRGYVLRKLLRRAVRYARLLGMNEPFLAKILPRLIQEMGSDYRELIVAENRIAEILTLEEESFIRTLKRGGNILQNIIEKASKTSQKQITGEEAFTLKDTYGFPLEEILLIAKDTGLSVNLETYQLLEEKAKEKSRGAHVSHSQEAEKDTLYRDYIDRNGACQFSGYHEKESKAKILSIVVEGKLVDQLSAGQTGEILLDITPFYAEKGGQVGDTGVLSHQNATFRVVNCVSPYTGVISHVGKLEKGTMKPGDVVIAQIDRERRHEIENNHSATHLLHYALQQVLGPQIRQAGSLVEATRLRFDFTHHKQVSEIELRQIEELVNSKIREDLGVKTLELSYDEVQKRSDIKQFFGDKYGSVVRMVDMDYSKELCGGTHTDHLGKIGLFRITKESSIGSGIRRIEAITGKLAEEWMYQKEDILEKAAALLQTTPSKLLETLENVEQERKKTSLKLREYHKQILEKKADHLLHDVKTLGKVSVLAKSFSDLSSNEDLVIIADYLLQKKPSLAVFLVMKMQDKCQLFIKLSSDLVSAGWQASHFIKEIAPLVGGSGGGKADSAQAGGKQVENVEKALDAFQQLIASKC